MFIMERMHLNHVTPFQRWDWLVALLHLCHKFSKLLLGGSDPIIVPSHQGVNSIVDAVSQLRRVVLCCMSFKGFHFSDPN